MSDTSWVLDQLLRLLAVENVMLDVAVAELVALAGAAAVVAPVSSCYKHVEVVHSVAVEESLLDMQNIWLEAEQSLEVVGTAPALR